MAASGSALHHGALLVAWLERYQNLRAQPVPGEQRGGAASGRGGRERGADGMRRVAREIREVADSGALESRLGVGGEQRDDDIEGGGWAAECCLM